MEGPIEGSGVALDPMTKPAVIVGYVLPWWNGRVSLETVLSPPLHVTFRATGTLRDESIAPDALGIPTGVPPLGSELGEAEAAPPLVTAVYRLTKANATVENLHVRTPSIPLFESAEVGSATMGLWVNPLIVHVGVGVDL